MTIDECNIMTYREKNYVIVYMNLIAAKYDLHWSLPPLCQPRKLTMSCNFCMHQVDLLELGRMIKAEAERREREANKSPLISKRRSSDHKCLPM